MTNKNVWFLSKNPRASILVIHGLNLRPATMDPLCEFLNLCGFHALRVSLAGHEGGVEQKHLSSFETWSRQTSEAFCEMQTRFPEFDNGILGYSLGGTLAINMLHKRTDLKPKVLILLAPAVIIQPYFNLARPLMILRHLRCSVISLLPRSYSAQRFTPVSMYSAALQAFDAVSSIRDMPTHWPAIVFCSPQDGLVNFRGLKYWVGVNKLNNWNIESLDTSSSAIRNFNHLIIDQNGLGQTSWEFMTTKLRNYLETFFPNQNSSEGHV